MGPRKDLTNHRFGMLVAKSRVCKYPANNSWMWHCVCDCGNETLVQISHLTSGNTQSCGCQVSKAKNKHNKSRSSEWTAWRRIRAKKICPEEWNEFVDFIRDVGCKPSKDHVLWRHDFSRIHSKANTYWRKWDDNCTRQTEPTEPTGFIDIANGLFGLPGETTDNGTGST